MNERTNEKKGRKRKGKKGRKGRRTKGRQRKVGVWSSDVGA